MFWSVWASFWGELNTPDNFSADPEGALKNQIGHICLGLFATVAICVVHGLIMGEMPYRMPVFSTVTFTYVVVIEYWRQGWKGADSIIDSGFVALGAAAPLVSLKEVAFDPEIDLRLQLPGAVAVLVVIPAALLAYVVPRIVRRERQRAR